MNGSFRIAAILLATAVGVCGCATLNPRADYERAAKRIAEATGQDQIYQPADEAIIARKVGELLADGITASEAVHMCLLNNPRLQGAFREVGMARADVVQAGLLSNPFLGISFRLPSGGGLANVEADLAQNIADLWQIPIRKRAAERSLDRAVLELARQAAELAADAKAAYYEAVGAQQGYQIAQENLANAQTLLDLTQRRLEAGAATQLEVNMSRSAVLDVELEVESARLALADARRALATLLGITTDADQLVLLDPLPQLPPETPGAERLMEVARAWRLDIRAARQALSAARARLEEQYRRIFPTVEVGVALERGERRRQGGRDILADTARASIAGGGLTAPGIQPRSERRVNTDLIVGPSVALELPIFDQNQAQIAKARYSYQQAVKSLDALDRAVTQEVRSAVDRARTAWKVARTYRDRSLPLANSNLELSRKAYQEGQASFLAVLEAQRVYVEVRRRYVEAAREAATTLPQLERVISLPLEELISKAGAPPASQSRTPHGNDGGRP